MKHEKKSNLSVIYLFILILLVIYGCNTRTGSVDESAQRIVSLSPNYTEIVYSLGAEKRLVGRTDSCDYPPECKAIPVVGSYATPNEEKLAAMRPTLILTADFQDDRVHNLLLNKKIDVYRNDPQNFVQLYEAICQTAIKVGKKAEGEALIQKMQLELGKIRLETQNRTGRPPRIMTIVWHNPLCVVGGDSFVAEAVRAAGGINVTDEIQTPYVNISPEKVVQWQPDIILFPQMNIGVSTETLLNYPGWEAVPAIKNKRIITNIPADLILRPGPRIVEGVKLLSVEIDVFEKRP